MELVASSDGGPLDTLRVVGLDQDSITTALSTAGCLDHRGAALSTTCRYAHRRPADCRLASRLPSLALPMAGRAAVFAPGDQRLWMIGTRHRRGGHSSLYVIDTHAARVEAVRALDPALERFWFASGEDNAVAMIAAPRFAPWYLVVLFEPNTLLKPTAIRVAGVRRRIGRALGGLRVDAGSVLFDAVGPGPLDNPRHPPVPRTLAIPLSELRSRTQGALFAPATP